MLIEVVGHSPPRPTTLFWKGLDMARRVIAVSIMTAGVLLTAFTITMALSYQINGRCTEQMAQSGNC